MRIEPERTWHYLLLTRSGVTPDEARRIVVENQRRVEKEELINGCIFNREFEALQKIAVGLPSHIFDRSN